MKRGDLVQYKGYYHLNGGEAQYIDVYGIVLRQIDCEIFEVLIDNKVMIIDEPLLTEVEKYG